MPLDKTHVQQVARLALLDLPPSENEKLTADLTAVSEYFGHTGMVDR
jgi:Asp-tRNA(Asn)/Glu-tRNA(Gln) amidotransferase C subunit